jgi:hypothetical protein
VNAHRVTLLLLLCLAVPARAQEPSVAPPSTDASEHWGLLLSAGVGLFSGTATGASLGHLLTTHLLVVTPVGLELGLALQWGGTFQTYTAYDFPFEPDDVGRKESASSFRGIGGEVRYRFLRDRRISPWVAFRLGSSTARNVRADASRPHLLPETKLLAQALGLGADVRIYGPLGATLGGSYQFCDLDDQVTGECAGAGLTLVLGPRLRF